MGEGLTCEVLSRGEQGTGPAAEHSGDGGVFHVVLNSNLK